jgi:cytochrome c-type biogenesis protein CcsB
VSIIAFHITAFLYFVATLVYIAYLISHRDKVLSLGRGILIGGFCIHTITIVTRWIEAGRTPTANLYESITVLVWIIVGLYILVDLRYKLSVLGSFVAPFALLLFITASFMPMEIVPLAPSLESYWLPIHVTLALLGNAFFVLAFLFGIMYLIQERHLKSHKIGGLYFLLPSLEILDELNYRSLTYGFPLLTLAMITGAIWAEYVWGSYWSWEPRQTWSLITWFLYAALLHGRLNSGWRGRKASILSIVGLVVLLGSFFAINLFSWGMHGFLK